MLEGYLIFIASLSHSGSTLLDLLLGGHSRFVGLGELSTVLKFTTEELKSMQRQICTCGKIASECDYWSQVISRLLAGDRPTLHSRYLLALDIFSDFFGDTQTLVDSSKNLDSLRACLDVPDIHIRVIHLVRDVRAFTISQIDSDRRYNRKKRNPLKLFRYWYLDNKGIQQFLEGNKIQSVQISFDELCLSPQEMMKELCEFLDVEIEYSMMNLRETGSHIIHGNRMRSQPEKNRTILYDYRWFYRNEWIFPAFINPRIMRYNTQVVYQHLAGKIWER